MNVPSVTHWRALAVTEAAWGQTHLPAPCCVVLGAHPSWPGCHVAGTVTVHTIHSWGLRRTVQVEHSAQHGLQTCTHAPLQACGLAFKHGGRRCSPRSAFAVGRELIAPQLR